MKRFHLYIATSVLVMACGAACVQAAETYETSLKAGETHLAAAEYDEAIAEFEAAYSQAKTNTKKALARSKKAFVLAFKKQDFQAAEEQADKVLALDNVEPVGRVTALQVKAKCVMELSKKKNRFERAEKLIDEALALKGVEWSRPDLLLLLGDCYRFSGRFEEALRTLRKITEMPSVNKGMKAVACLHMGFTHQYGRKDPVGARAAYKAAVGYNPGMEAEIEQHLDKLK
jgi:tetratricopeptide (TPR) repeat protein